MSEATAPAPVRPKAENVWVNLICNAVLPGFLLTHLSKDHVLGPVWGLVVSLSLPLGYGIYDFVARRKWNIFSIIGFVSTLLTGVMTLLSKGNPEGGKWIAIKEAAVPLILGLAIPWSLRTRQPLVRTLLYNDQVLDTARIHTALEARLNVAGFERLLVWASWVLAGSFFLSAALNYGLARWLLVGTPGTPEFNAQLGKMNWLSWPVIVVPSVVVMFYALFRLLKGVEEMTGLKGEDLFHHQPRPAKTQTAPETPPSAPRSEPPAA